MSDQLSASIDVGANLQRAIAGMKPEAALQAIRRGMNTGLELISSRILTERLTGKGPFPVSAHQLGVRSGRLRQSVRTTAARINGLEVVGSIGSRVVYAAAHEFGFTGTVQVKAHQSTRKTRNGRKLKVAARPVFPVRAHQRKVVIPERAPFRTGIKEHLPLLEDAIATDIKTSMQGA